MPLTGVQHGTHEFEFPAPRFACRFRCCRRRRLRRDKHCSELRGTFATIARHGGNSAPEELHTDALRGSPLRNTSMHESSGGTCIVHAAAQMSRRRPADAPCRRWPHGASDRPSHLKVGVTVLMWHARNLPGEATQVRNAERVRQVLDECPTVRQHYCGYYVRHFRESGR